MKRTEATTSCKPRLEQLEIKLAEENKNVSHLLVKLVQRQIKLTAFARMLITSNTSLRNSERRKPKTRMKFTDSEMELP